MNKRAFTLIELLIVIVIMGVIYTLAINNFTKLSDTSKHLSLANLKEYLHSLEYEKEVRLLCLDDCSECDVYVDGNKTQSIEGFLDDSVRSYRYEQSYGFIERKQDIFFNQEGIEENVCFSYSMDNSGIGEQMLIEYKDKYYDMSTFFVDTPIYNSIQDAQEKREKSINEVLR
ncbi:type II secretion system protein [Sulfurimonas sp.]